MRRRFDASNEHAKELRGDLANIGQKVDAHAVSIKHLDMQMAQLSSTVNPRQPVNFPSYTVQNPKNDGHCMAVTTRVDKQTIDPPTPSDIEDEVRREDAVVEASGELVNKAVKELEMPQKVTPVPRPPPPFPQRLMKKTEDGKYQHFITILKQLSINAPLIEDLEQMLGYAKFMKDMVTKKTSVSFEDDYQMQHCSVIATRSLVQKKEDMGALTIPCTIGLLHFAKVLCNLGKSINLIPLSIYKKLGLADPNPTVMRLLKADRTMKRPIGILHDVLVKVESFIFPADFVILDCELDFEVPIILKRSMKQSGELQMVSTISYRVESTSKVQIEERLSVEALAAVIMNFKSDGIDDYRSLVEALDRGDI
ncbi:uncharacterized protein [Solanum lycopersicum]|uniref:uncharacterized protein n=1 Tax=Solanum lycopersicum TaxID=4081 RepID=UPI00374961B6